MRTRNALTPLLPLAFVSNTTSHAASVVTFHHEALAVDAGLGQTIVIYLDREGRVR